MGHLGKKLGGLCWLWHRVEGLSGFQSSRLYKRGLTKKDRSVQLLGEPEMTGFCEMPPLGKPSERYGLSYFSELWASTMISE